MTKKKIDPTREVNCVEGINEMIKKYGRMVERFWQAQAMANHMNNYAMALCDRADRLITTDLVEYIRDRQLGATITLEDAQLTVNDMVFDLRPVLQDALAHSLMDLELTQKYGEIIDDEEYNKRTKRKEE